MTMILLTHLHNDHFHFLQPLVIRILQLHNDPNPSSTTKCKSKNIIPSEPFTQQEKNGVLQILYLVLNISISKMPRNNSIVK